MRRIQAKQRPSVYCHLFVMAALATIIILSGSCFLNTKITLCGQDLYCPPGWVCSANQAMCVKAGNCGDGRIDDLEVCDDGNNISGDGCSSDCTSEELCGNDIIDVAIGEQCDDGNTIPEDGCSAGCISEVCGNRIVDLKFGEECDTGPGDSLGCNSNCKFSRCGDGYRNSVAENCDNGDASDRQDCDGDCTSPECGDGHTNPNYRPPLSDARLEQCDNGMDSQTCNGNNGRNTTGRGYCQMPTCGDGYHNPKFDLSLADSTKVDAKLEACDAGEDTQACNGYDGKSMTGKGYCQMPACGDGYHNPKFDLSLADSTKVDAKLEVCDTGEDTQACNGHDGGNTTGKGYCQMPACGDGYHNPNFNPKLADSTKVDAQLEACDAGGDAQTCNGNNGKNMTGKGYCQVPTCGDGYHNPNYNPKLTDPTKVNAKLEACDTGVDSSDCNGNKNSDGKGNCQVPRCGDGYYNPKAEEECDFSDNSVPRGGCVDGLSCLMSPNTVACTCL
jgi:cysteine-rich repeat protein